MDGSVAEMDQSYDIVKSSSKQFLFKVSNDSGRFNYACASLVCSTGNSDTAEAANSWSSWRLASVSWPYPREIIQI